MTLFLFIGANDYTNWISFPEDGDESEWDMDELYDGIVTYAMNRHKLRKDRQVRKQNEKRKVEERKLRVNK